MATKKYKETVASVIALAVGAFLLGRAMRNKDSTNTISGVENVEEVPITREANKIAKTKPAYIYWDTIKYVYVVEDFCYPDGNGRYLIRTVNVGQKITKSELLNAYYNFQNSWGY